MARIKLFFIISVFVLFTEYTPVYTQQSTRTITVTDSYNRTVTLQSEIKRIGCLYAFSGHVVTMLGRGEDIVAVVRGLKRDKMLSDICPSIQNAAVPNLNDSLNMEELASVKPDVVFIKDTVAMKKSDTDTLTKLGIPYVVISFSSIAEQKRAILIIGKTIGRKKEAEEYISYYNSCEKRVKKAVEGIPKEERVRLYHSILEPLKTDGKKSISAEWMDLAGVINVSINDKNGFSGEAHFANIEQVLLWNPRAIITHEDSSLETITGSSQWSSIDAVRNKKVFRMPNGISRWGHPGSLETPLAMLWTLKNIYPEYAGSINMKSETINFYKKFFNYTLTEQMAEQVLQGKGMRKSKKGKHHD
ncbi:MAG TPA: ABC transporter substrate-binding protein [Spirochaetota bacterium]|nr:ABC transporter substrate-binding protein [Spirochaetota bacterium]